MKVFKTLLLLLPQIVIAVQAIGGGCPSTIIANNNGCYLYTLSVDIDEPNASYEWTVGSSTFSTPTVNYAVAFPGEVLVSLNYTSDNCANGITLSTVLNYNDCGAVCPASITSEEIECNVFELSFFQVNAGMQATWTINNETFSGTEITYTLPSAGTYAVNAIVTNSNCPNAINLSKTLTWTTCAAQCADSIIATNLGCNTYEITTNVLEVGSNSEWTINGTLLVGDTVYYSLEDTNDVFVQLNYTGPQCSFGTMLSTELNFEPCTSGCPQNILVVPLSCNTYELSLNASQPENITWNINGQTYTGNNIGYALQQEGTTNVLAFYTGTDCSTGATISTTLVSENCTDVCPAEIMVIENTCNYYHFAIDADYPEIGAVWTVNGDTVSSSSLELMYTLPSAGEYEIMVQYNAPDCPLGTTLSAVYQYQQCNNVCPTAIIVDSIGCNQYTLTLNNIAANETALWNLNGAVLPAINAITIELPQEGMANVSVYYEGMECTSGVTLDTILFWNPCGDGTCTASFTYEQGDDGVVLFTNTSTYVGTPSYSWDFGDASTSSETSPTAQYTENGTYPVCLIVTTATCQNSYCTTLSVQSIFECADSEIELTLSATNTGGNNAIVNYSLTDENNVEVALTEFVLPPGTGTNTQSYCMPDGCYAFELSGNMDLTDLSLLVYNATNQTTLLNATWQLSTTDTIIYFGVNANCEDAVGNIANENLLLLHPNPANQTTNITLNHEELNGVIKIYNEEGKLIFTENLSAKSKVISTQQMPAGLYSVVYETATKQHRQQLLIVH
jgi:PKD repeat protein